MTCARCHRGSLSERVLCSWGCRSKPHAWHTAGARWCGCSQLLTSLPPERGVHRTAVLCHVGPPCPSHRDFTTGLARPGQWGVGTSGTVPILGKAVRGPGTSRAFLPPLPLPKDSMSWGGTVLPRTDPRTMCCQHATRSRNKLRLL